MLLEDILSITSEHTTVNVVEINYDSGAVLGRYDGKDSISKDLNKRKVEKQYVFNNELYIVVR